jgi:hypothetical protein
VLLLVVGAGSGSSKLISMDDATDWGRPPTPTPHPTTRALIIPLFMYIHRDGQTWAESSS